MPTMSVSHHCALEIFIDHNSVHSILKFGNHWTFNKIRANWI